MTYNVFSGTLNLTQAADVLANRRNIHHRPTLLWRFRDSGAGCKTADLLTYLLSGATEDARKSLELSVTQNDVKDLKEL